MAFIPRGILFLPFRHICKSGYDIIRNFFLWIALQNSSKKIFVSQISNKDSCLLAESGIGGHIFSLGWVAHPSCDVAMEPQESICCQGNGRRKEDMKFISVVFYDDLVNFQLFTFEVPSVL